MTKTNPASRHPDYRVLLALALSAPCLLEAAPACQPPRHKPTESVIGSAELLSAEARSAPACQGNPASTAKRAEGARALESPPLEEKNYTPHITYLGPSASFRIDELTHRAQWEEGQPWSLKRAFDLPDWISLTFEERVRYESYATPWIKDTTQGQYGIPIQSVVWFKAHPTEDVRFEIQFWDARQYGSPDPNKINTTMVNVLNLEQVFAGWINHNLFGQDIDSESKLGQMQMAVGSNRLIGIVPFKSTQFQYVGFQNRLRSETNGWELLTFANTPVEMLPSNATALVQNAWVWNRPITDAVFAGGFLDKTLSATDHLELYFYYLHEGLATNLSPTLYTPGFRVFRQPEKDAFDFEIETIGQTGQKRVNSQAPILSVGSIMQHIQAGYTFDAPWTPRFLLQWDYASSHFDSLFPSTVSEFGPDGILALFARNNINSPGYRLFLNPAPNITLYAANRFWWLADQRSTEGWSPANLVDTSGKAGSYVGQTWELNGRWDAHENLAVQVGWQVLMKGNFAEYAPDAPSNHSNVNYWYVQSLVRF
jgi:Alginate export